MVVFPLTYFSLLLCRYYGEVLPAAGSKDAAVLDICSSWVSHYPEGYTAGRISGMLQPLSIGE